jgi:hypothetical protein
MRGHIDVKDMVGLCRRLNIPCAMDDTGHYKVQIPRRTFKVAAGRSNDGIPGQLRSYLLRTAKERGINA